MPRAAKRPRPPFRPPTSRRRSSASPTEASALGLLSWLRREKPLHERLAEEGGLGLRGDEPHDALPRWGEVGIHGVHRPRRWDAVVSAEAAGLTGDTLSFTALPDGTLLADEDVPDGALAPLADAVETELEPPYRAEAVRHDGVWAVAAKRIEVVAVDEDVDGDEIELSLRGGERMLLVDGRPAFGSVRALERLAGERFDDYVVRATRLDENLWEVAIAPL